MLSNNTKQDAYERVQRMRAGSFVCASYEYLLEMRSQLLEYQQKLDRQIALRSEQIKAMEEEKDNFDMVRDYLSTRDFVIKDGVFFDDPRGEFCQIPPSEKYSEEVQKWLGLDPDKFERVAIEVLRHLQSEEMQTEPINPICTLRKDDRGWFYRDKDLKNLSGPFESVQDAILDMKSKEISAARGFAQTLSTAWIYRKKEGWYYTSPSGKDQGPFNTKREAIQQAKYNGYGIENDGRTAYVYKHDKKWWYQDEKDLDLVFGPFKTKKDAATSAKGNGFKVVYE